MTCINARDTITQADGTPFPNDLFVPATDLTTGGHFNAYVTSYCRTVDGTWIGWIENAEGDGIDAYGVNAYGRDRNKADWPDLIASTYVVRVGFFPDDGSGSVVYELAIDPFYNWNDLGGSKSPSDPCSLYPFLGDKYADVGFAQLTGWTMSPLDVQVKTDGANVWVVALARESVKYPYLYNSPTEIDQCGNSHPDFEAYWAEGHSDPFFHDDDAGNRWWIYFKGGFLGGSKPFGDYDDAGNDHSFRWQPARVTVWCGDLGGFTILGTIDAKFENDNGQAGGLCSAPEAAASPAEPGVLHLLWAEGGQFGSRTVELKRGQRVNYSRWDATGQLLDTDLLYVEEVGGGDVQGDWVWTAEMVLRNDHGSPIAIYWPWTTDGVSRFVSGEAEFWDLSSGAVNVLQTASLDLAPTFAEGNTGVTPQSVFGWEHNSSLIIGSLGFVAIRRSQFASSIYSDPTLDGAAVYLLCVAYGQGDQQPGCRAFLRVLCDGSATFDYMDGIRSPDYSIVSPPFANDFRCDFVSEPDDVWMPVATNAGGAVLQLDRQCLRGWSLLPAFPIPNPLTGYEDGFWADGLSISTPTLISDDSGDWLYGAGTGPLPTVLSSDPTYIAALKAKICRCCVPCIGSGVHLWTEV